MLRAMDSAVAGLRSHQEKLDVIGNNIANVNTAGYKAQSYTFKETMYQTSVTSTSGSGSSGGSGGVNSAQYGYGTMMGSISTDMSTSTPTQTGGLTAAISGDGFFVTGTRANTIAVSSDDVEETSETIKSSDLEYTRVGQFKIDSDGYLVDCNSNNFVYGFRLSNAFDETSIDNLDMENLVPLRVCTPEGEFSDDEDADIALAVSVKIDSNGYITIELSQTNTVDSTVAKKFPTLENANAGIDADDFLARATLGQQIDISSTGIKDGSVYRAAMAGYTEDYSYGYSSNSSSGVEYYHQGTLNTEDDLRSQIQLGEEGTDASGNDIITITDKDYNKINYYVTKDATGNITNYYTDQAKTDEVQEADLREDCLLGVSNEDGTITVTLSDGEKKTYWEEYDSNKATANKIYFEYSGADSRKTKEELLNTVTDGEVTTDSSNNSATLTVAAKEATYWLYDGKYYEVQTDSNGNIKTATTNPITGKSETTSSGKSTEVTELVEAVIGRIAIASFQNQEGLTKAGNSYYTASKNDNTGLCSVTGANMGGASALSTGYIEASNVDMAKEFSDLITTQRGFQANSKIITVSDQILEELVNMKR